MDLTGRKPAPSIGCETKNDLSKAADESSASKKSFTCKQKVALGLLAAADFMSFCSMSIMAPFFPKEAASKGMSETLSGFVFSFYALIMFIFSPIFGKVLPRVGAKLTFIVGVLISGICSIIFGCLEYVQDYNTFTVLAFAVRGMEALGSCAYSTAGYVIVMNIFPDNAGMVRGILETFVGLGMSVGPAIGGLLFANTICRQYWYTATIFNLAIIGKMGLGENPKKEKYECNTATKKLQELFTKKVGGFGLPFYVVGLVTIIIAPLNACLLPSDCQIDKNCGSLRSLLKLPATIVVCLIIIVVSISWSFLDPTLEPCLRKYNLTPGNIGFLFLLLSAMYGISCPGFGWLADRMKNYWWLMVGGLLLNSVNLLLLGPCPLLKFLDNSLWLNIVALSALGVSVGMGLMPTYQGLLDSAMEGGLGDSLGTHSIIAGLWSCAYSLGEVLGPAAGGALLEHYQFPFTATSMAILNFVTAIGAMCYFCWRKKSKVICNGDVSICADSKEIFKNRDFQDRSITTAK